MDISLSDIAWVGGGLLTVMITSILFTRRAEIAQALGIMSLPWAMTVHADGGAIEGELPATTTLQNDPNGVAMTTTEYNALLFAAKADALTAMVHAGKVGETEGIKIVFGVSPSSTNKTYQAARAMLKARLARLEPEKFKLTAEQKALREGLGLPNHRNA